jgi:hypothetical protein
MEMLVIWPDLSSRIKGRRDYYYCALDDELDLDRNAEQQYLIRDDDDHGGSGQRAEDRSTPPLQRYLAYNAGDDRVELIALTDPIVDESDVAAQNQACDRR